MGNESDQQRGEGGDDKEDGSVDGEDKEEGKDGTTKK